MTLKYNILIQHGTNKELFKYYQISNTIGGTTTIINFETEDVAELETVVNTLLETYGKNNIKIVANIDYEFDLILN